MKGEEVVGIRRMRCSNSLCKKRICDIGENSFGVIVIERAEMAAG